MQSSLLKLIPILMASLAIQSCVNTDPGSTQDKYADTDIIKGSYIYGHEVSSLKPCGSDQELWVTAETKLLSQLQQDYSNLVKDPYQEVFVSLKGKQLAKADDGFAAEYSGQYLVTEVMTVQKENICP